ncbi:MAG: NAD(P)-dependent oxidoreductase [Candidatus Omnitrophica bacterium]|nr:NAD(P)-dependent oxidoreductase [Candidatus Omnitrophota bacterium]
MKILVTGATGFIGKAIAKSLLSQGHKVYGLVRNPLKAQRLSHLGIQLIKADISDKKSLLALPDFFEVIVHSAGYVGEDKKKLYLSNVLGTENICWWAVKANVKRFLHISSVAVVSGHNKIPLTEELPYWATNNYGYSKIEAEKIVLSYAQNGLSTVILRPAMVYGVGEPHLLELLLFLLRFRLLPVPNKGKNKWHLVDIKLVCQTVIKTLENKEIVNRPFFVADFEVLTAKEIFKALAEGIKAPCPILLSTSATKMLAKLPFIGKRVNLFLKDRVYDTSRLQQLGVKPIGSVYESLQEVAKAYREGIKKD